MLISSDGVIKHAKIVTKIFKNLEHGALAKVNALVIHRTAAKTTKSTLISWQKSQFGTHFLICTTGKIFQTAHTNKQCWHLGSLRSRCRTEKICEERDSEIIKNILLDGSDSWESRFRILRYHERKKSYPERYPTNGDSIGIEIVGAYLGGKGDDGIFEPLNLQQKVSFFWLVKELIEKYGLSSVRDIYAHGHIARKKPSEGAGARNFLISYNK